jgi:hypothetical protein
LFIPPAVDRSVASRLSKLQEKPLLARYLLLIFGREMLHQAEISRVQGQLFLADKSVSLSRTEQSIRDASLRATICG